MRDLWPGEDELPTQRIIQAELAQPVEAEEEPFVAPDQFLVDLLFGVSVIALWVVLVCVFIYPFL